MGESISPRHEEAGERTGALESVPGELALQRVEGPAAAMRGLTTEGHPDFRAGTAALAAMPDEEFEVRLIAMRRGRERITRIHRELMDPDTDYGVIPGTKQPTLLKPGAEKLCDFYRLAAQFHPEITYGDGVHSPPITVVTECRLHLGTLDGPVVNTGHGAANSWEKRYRYRRGERACPACEKVGTIIKGKAEYGGGWLCLLPETPILYEDYVWRPIGEAKPGDRVFGFDEHPPGGRRCDHRRFRPSVIEAVWSSRQQTQRLVTENADILTTPGHRWLRHRPAHEHWSATETLHPGNILRSIGMHASPVASEDYRLGYLAGITLGDGTMRFTPGRRQSREKPYYWRVAVLATDEAILGRIVAYLALAGVEAHVRPFDASAPRTAMKKVEVRAGTRLEVIHQALRPRKTREFQRGFLAGFFDAEGSGSSGHLRLYQKDRETLGAIQQYGANLGFAFDLGDPTPDGCSAVRLRGTMLDRLRFFSEVQPALSRKCGLYGVEMRHNPSPVLAVETGPVRDVVDIQTSTGTFFAAGIATHNCFAKKGGCGAKFAESDPTIVDQPVGDVENPDPYDLLNTLLKISEKRSYVDATLRATATSGLYTQDMEEAADPKRPEAPMNPEEPGPAPVPLLADPRSPAVSSPSSVPSAGRTIDVSAKVSPPATLKEAYHAFLGAMESAGFDRSDKETARQLMQAGTGRASRREAPYTVEEFLHVAEQLRRRASRERRAA
jgi:hypothetical protein